MNEQPDARANAATRDGVAPANVVHGIPADEVDTDDPERRLYTSEPVEADDGTPIVVQQRSAMVGVAGGAVHALCDGFGADGHTSGGPLTFFGSGAVPA